MLPWACLFGPGLHAQVEQLATSGDGRTLLVHSYFRLQTESDVDAQGKIFNAKNSSLTLSGFNDDFATTHADVIALLRKADV